MKILIQKQKNIKGIQELQSQQMIIIKNEQDKLVENDLNAENFGVYYCLWIPATNINRKYLTQFSMNYNLQ